MLLLTVLVHYNQPVRFQNDFVDNTPVAVSGLCSLSLVGERRSVEKTFSPSFSLCLCLSVSDSLSLSLSPSLSLPLSIYCEVVVHPTAPLHEGKWPN